MTLDKLWRQDSRRAEIMSSVAALSKKVVAANRPCLLAMLVSGSLDKNSPRKLITCPSLYDIFDAALFRRPRQKEASTSSDLCISEAVTAQSLIGPAKNVKKTTNEMIADLFFKANYPIKI